MSYITAYSFSPVADTLSYEPIPEDGSDLAAFATMDEALAFIERTERPDPKLPQYLVIVEIETLRVTHDVRWTIGTRRPRWLAFPR